jgi:hypothetical protein
MLLQKSALQNLPVWRACMRPALPTLVSAPEKARKREKGGGAGGGALWVFKSKPILLSSVHSELPILPILKGKR